MSQRTPEGSRGSNRPAPSTMGAKVLALPKESPRDDSAELVRLLHLTERREPLVVRIALWVATGIIEGRLRPAQDLNSVELSNRFNTSRTPVREALMLLEQEGLVEMRARRRPRVASFTPKQVEDIYQVRQHLLSLVVRLAVDVGSEDDVAVLRHDVDQLQAHADAGDIDAYFWGHGAFHEKLSEIGQNAALKEVVDSLSIRVLVLRHAALEQPGRLTRSAAEQQRIIYAIEARDGDLAALLISRSTLAALDSVREVLHADGSLATDPDPAEADSSHL